LRELSRPMAPASFASPMFPHRPGSPVPPREGADILLWISGRTNRGPRDGSCGCDSRAASANVILSDSESESLAVESLQQGAQDSSRRGGSTAPDLRARCGYAIERHACKGHCNPLADRRPDRIAQSPRFLSLAEQQLRLIPPKGLRSFSILWISTI